MHWGVVSVEEMLGSILKGRFMFPVKVPRGVVAISNSKAKRGYFTVEPSSLKKKR